MLKRCIVTFLFITGFLSINRSVLALTLDTGLTDAGASATYKTDTVTIADTVGLLIKVVIGLLGIVFLVLTIYSGITWMTAAGDSKKVDSAKSTLGSAVIGLIICLSAYAITSFVIKEIQYTQQGVVSVQ